MRQYDRPSNEASKPNEKVGALARLLSQMESRIHDDVSFPLLETDLDCLMQQQCREGQSGAGAPGQWSCESTS